MLALLLLAAQTGKVSVTVPCAGAKEALASLGRQLGMDLRPSGAVGKDYFLVRAVDAEPQEVLDKVAAALTASWTEKDGVRYLGRTHAQELELADFGFASMRDYVNAFLARQPAPKPWTRDRAAAYLRQTLKPGGTLDGEKFIKDMEESGPYHDLLVEFVRAVGADELVRIEGRNFVKYEWNPAAGSRKIPASLRPAAEDVAKSVRAIGAALREIGQEYSVGYGDMSPDHWALTVNRFGRSLSMQVTAAGTNPMPFVHFAINMLTTPDQFATVLPTNDIYKPSALAKAFFDALLPTAKGPANLPLTTSDPALTKWFEDRFPTDPLQVGAAEAILQALEKADLNGVAVLPDAIAPFGSWFPMEGQSLRSLLANLLNSHVVDVSDGWLLARHSLRSDSMERFDRDALAQLSLQIKKEGWMRIEPLAAFASHCDGDGPLFHALRVSDAINPEQTRVRMIGLERYRLLRIYDSLPPAAKRQAKSGGATWRLGELPMPAREVLTAALKDKNFLSGTDPEPSRLEWSSRFWFGAPGGGGPSVTAPPDSVVVVRLDTGARIAIPDKGGKAMYFSGPFTPEEAAARIRNQQSPNTDPDFAHDFDYVAVVQGERLLVRVVLPTGETYENGLVLTSQTSATQFSPYQKLEGPLGDALREELRRLGG